jgi:hypothetical protein
MRRVVKKTGWKGNGWESRSKPSWRRSCRPKPLLEHQFSAAVHLRRGKFIGKVSGGGMIYLRAPAILLEAFVRFRPAWQCGAHLGPMDHGGFVAPRCELAHGLPVDARSHKLLHGRLVRPESAGPERVLLFSKHSYGDVRFSAGRLPRRAQGVPHKHREEAPRPQPQPRNGDQGHLAILNEAVSPRFS